MARRKFNQKQIKHLKELKKAGVIDHFKNGIVFYTGKTKSKAVCLSNKGEKPAQIYKDLGFDKEVMGQKSLDYFRTSLNYWCNSDKYRIPVETQVTMNVTKTESKLSIADCLGGILDYIDDTEKEFDGLEQKLSDRDACIKVLKEQAVEDNNEIKRLNDLYSTTEKRCQELLDENHKQFLKNEDLESENEQLKKKIEFYSSIAEDKERLEKKVARLQDELHSALGKNSLMRCERDEARKALDETVLIKDDALKKLAASNRELSRRGIPIPKE